jgi:hypothetical protein
MKCPYPQCNTPEDIRLTEHRSAICQACSYPIILCPHCNSTSRSAARFCRKCSHEVSYKDILSNWLETFCRNPGCSPEERRKTLIFRRAEVGQLLLQSLLGYLVVVTDQEILLFNPDVPGDSLHKWPSPGPPLGAVLAENETSLLITFADRLLTLRFVPEAMMETWGELSQAKFLTPARVNDQKWQAVAIQSEGKAVLVGGDLSRPGLMNSQDFPVKNPCLNPPPLALSPEIWYVLTAEAPHKPVVYDVACGEVLWEGFEDQLDPLCLPCLDPATLEVFIASTEGKIFRISLIHKRVFPVGGQRFTLPQLAFDKTDNYLVVTHSQGCTILEPWVGSTIWDLRRDCRAHLICSGLRAQVNKGLITFWGVRPGGGMDAYILTPGGWQEPTRLEGLREIVGSPVLSLGYLSALELDGGGLRLTNISLLAA